MNCGAHLASSCGECPQVIYLMKVQARILTIKGHGKDWCHGECLWTEDICVGESASVMKREEGPTGVNKSSIEVTERLPVMKREEGPNGADGSSPVTSVNCGAHLASSCGECPQVIILMSDDQNHENS